MCYISQVFSLLSDTLFESLSLQQERIFPYDFDRETRKEAYQSLTINIIWVQSLI